MISGGRGGGVRELCLDVDLKRIWGVGVEEERRRGELFF